MSVEITWCENGLWSTNCLALWFGNPREIKVQVCHFRLNFPKTHVAVHIVCKRNLNFGCIIVLSENCSKNLWNTFVNSCHASSFILLLIGSFMPYDHTDHILYRVAQKSCTFFNTPYLSTYNSVRLVRTPEHCGIQGNEMADSLSRKACATKYTGMEPILGITPPTVCSELQDWARRENSGSSGEKQRNAIRPSSFSDKQILA